MSVVTKLKLTGAAVAATAFAVALLAGLQSIQAQEAPVQLKVSLFTPPTGILNVQMKSIKKRVEEDSKGKIVLSIFEASQMGPPERQFDLVRTGVADVSIMLMNMVPGRFPLMEMGSLPNLISAEGTEQTSGLLSSAVLKASGEFLTKEFAGAKLMNVAISPPPVILTKKEVTSLEGLKNLRIRHPGKVHLDTLDAFGAVPVSVRPTELSEAMSRGQIDGVLTIYSGVTTFKLQDIAKHTIEIPSGGMVFGIFMNEAIYDKIPSHLKPVIDKYFGAAIQPEWSQLFIDEEVAARKQLEEQGVVTRTLPDADRAAAAEIAGKLRDKAIADREANGLPAGRYVKALQAAAASK